MGFSHFELIVIKIKIYDFRGTADMDDIFERKKTGLFQVGAIHSTFLIDLKDPLSNKITFTANTQTYSGISLI